MPEGSTEGPEYGPRGYLPDRAARRARKIVLREPMGLHWPVAAALAGLVVVAVGVVWLLLGTGAPGVPFVEAGELARVDPRGSALVDLAGAERRVLVVRGGGGVAVFEQPAVTAVWCPASGRLEATGGRIWDLEGRLLAGRGVSLQPLRGQVHDSTLYVHSRPTLPGPPSAPRADVVPQCADGA
ncbi:MAG: hypothetical protein ACR2MA_00785 [Egibacteraceae bacterium]